jgi:hypothetical protein
MRDRELAEKYPNIYISEDMRAVWVCRDGRDAEAMRNGELTNELLASLNDEAAKAKQDGWFYCSKCHTAKPRSEYGFFYFAGNYCKDCQTANPDLYRRAMAETYN